MIIAELSNCGYKFHNYKSRKYKTDTKKFAFHTYMMNMYVSILENTLEYHELRRKYLRKGED